MPDFWAFLFYRIFLGFILEKKLDFLDVPSHNNRAFKLKSNQKKKSTPEISRLNRNIVNKSSSSK